VCNVMNPYDKGHMPAVTQEGQEQIPVVFVGSTRAPSVTHPEKVCYTGTGALLPFAPEGISVDFEPICK
jgi:hypothetical protein